MRFGDWLDFWYQSYSKHSLRLGLDQEALNFLFGQYFHFLLP